MGEKKQKPDIDSLTFAMGLAECLGTGHTGDFEECLLCPLEKKCGVLSGLLDTNKPRPPCEECIYQAQAAQEQNKQLDELLEFINANHAAPLHYLTCQRIKKYAESLRKGAP